MSLEELALDSLTVDTAHKGTCPASPGARPFRFGGSDIKAAHAGVRGPNNGKRLENRVDLGLVASRGNPSTLDGIDLTNAQDQLGDLTAGQSHPFTLKVTPGDLGISKSGVYELAV